MGRVSDRPVDEVIVEWRIAHISLVAHSVRDNADRTTVAGYIAVRAQRRYASQIDSTLALYVRKMGGKRAGLALYKAWRHRMRSARCQVLPR